MQPRTVRAALVLDASGTPAPARRPGHVTAGAGDERRAALPRAARAPARPGDAGLVASRSAATRDDAACSPLPRPWEGRATGRRASSSRSTRGRRCRGPDRWTPRRPVRADAGAPGPGRRLPGPSRGHRRPLARRDAGIVAVAAAAALGGLALPPLSSTVRIVWPRLAPDELRSTAYALRRRCRRSSSSAGRCSPPRSQR